MQNEVQLTNEDLDFILESLKYTKRNFEDYEKYPSYEYKQSRIKTVNDLADKIKTIKKNQ